MYEFNNLMTDSGDSRTSRIASGYRVMRTILGGTKACLQPKWNSNESNSLTRHVENSFRVPSTYRTLASEGEIPRTQWANKYYSLTNACFCRNAASRVVWRQDAQTSEKYSPCTRTRIPEIEKRSLPRLEESITIFSSISFDYFSFVYFYLV